jgi:hypothetical protein
MAGKRADEEKSGVPTSAAPRGSKKAPRTEAPAPTPDAAPAASATDAASPIITTTVAPVVRIWDATLDALATTLGTSDELHEVDPALRANLTALFEDLRRHTDVAQAIAARMSTAEALLVGDLLDVLRLRLPAVLDAGRPLAARGPRFRAALQDGVSVLRHALIEGASLRELFTVVRGLAVGAMGDTSQGPSADELPGGALALHPHHELPPGLRQMTVLQAMTTAEAYAALTDPNAPPLAMPWPFAHYVCKNVGTGGTTSPAAGQQRLCMVQNLRKPTTPGGQTLASLYVYWIAGDTPHETDLQLRDVPMNADGTTPGTWHLVGTAIPGIAAAITPGSPTQPLDEE